MQPDKLACPTTQAISRAFIDVVERREVEHLSWSLRKIEFDRLRAADYRARKRQIDMLPKRIAKLDEHAAALVKAAKGLGKR